MNIEKAKPRIGKPYAMQVGRKAGKGAGHIKDNPETFDLKAKAKDIKDTIWWTERGHPGPQTQEEIDEVNKLKKQLREINKKIKGN